MGLRKRFRDFRDWCPQPPDYQPSKLKRYSVPIAAVFTVNSCFVGFSFLCFLGVMSHPSLPIVPSVNVASPWSIKTVDQKGADGVAFMALDSKNNPHICYIDSYGTTQNPDNLMYASWTGSRWNIQNITQGSPDSFVLDSNNYPLIVYGGDNGLMFS